MFTPTEDTREGRTERTTDLRNVDRHASAAEVYAALHAPHADLADSGEVAR